MRIHLHNYALGCAFGVLVACAQPGDERVRPDQQAVAEDEECAAGEACTAPGSGRTSAPAVPAAPPVPDSPLKVNCTQLPTQLERDTCTNRKESTV
jgi:hypothetical protein